MVRALHLLPCSKQAREQLRLHRVGHAEKVGLHHSVTAAFLVIWNEERSLQQARRNDGHTVITILLEVLISRHDKIGSRMRGRKFDKRAIAGVAHALPAMAGFRKHGNGSEDSQEPKGRNLRISKVGLQARAVQHFFELGERRVTHDGNNLATQDGVDDLSRRSRAGN